VSNPPKLPSTGTNAVGTMAAGLLLLVAGYYLLVISEFGRRPRIPAVRTTGSALP
jgi:LPXTG-motif cell wall-anchored protein